MAALVVILAFFTHVLATEEKQLIAKELLAPYRKVRNFMLISACLFLLTMAPQFWSLTVESVPIRFYLWLAPLALFWIGRTPERLPGAKNARA
jgi:hypothetical protein